MISQTTQAIGDTPLTADEIIARVKELKPINILGVTHAGEEMGAAVAKIVAHWLKMAQGKSVYFVMEMFEVPKLSQIFDQLQRLPPGMRGNFQKFLAAMRESSDTETVEKSLRDYWRRQAAMSTAREEKYNCVTLSLLQDNLDKSKAVGGIKNEIPLYVIRLLMELRRLGFGSSLNRRIIFERPSFEAFRSEVRKKSQFFFSTQLEGRKQYSEMLKAEIGGWASSQRASVFREEGMEKFLRRNTYAYQIFPVGNSHIGNLRTRFSKNEDTAVVIRLHSEDPEFRLRNFSKEEETCFKFENGEVDFDTALSAAWAIRLYGIAYRQLHVVLKLQTAQTTPILQHIRAIPEKRCLETFQAFCAQNLDMNNLGEWVLAAYNDGRL